MSGFVRVYLPLDDERMGDLAAGSLDGDAETAYAITDAFRAVMPASEDQEGLEFAVLQDAAAAAAVRGLRVVGVADVRSEALQPAGDSDDPARVTVRGPIERRRFASLHVLDPAGERDPDSDLELSWYDITELDQVRGLT